MEQEIDLRPYFAALLQRWRLIVGVTALAVVLAIGIVLLQPPSYTYMAQLLFRAEQSQLQFDPRFSTQSSLLTDTASRAQILRDLASSTLLEPAVIRAMPPELVSDGFATGDLADRFDISIAGDLINISITDTNPEKAEILLDLWVNAYIDLINQLYGFDAEQVAEIEEQLVVVQSRYERSQAALEAFIGRGELVQLEQRIEEIETILEGAIEANQELYNQYLERARELDAIINDARTLREQVLRGNTDAVADSLGQLLLRARVAGNFELPVNLRFDLLGESETTAVDAAEIDELIQVLEQRRSELLAEGQQFVAALTGADDGNFALPLDVRNAYEAELASLQERYEQVSARENALRQERDIALESLGILQRKLNEQSVAAGTIESEVKLLGITPTPPQSMLVRLVLAAVIAGVMGAVLTALVVIILTVIGQLRQSGSSQPEHESTPDQPRDRTAAGQP